MSDDGGPPGAGAPQLDVVLGRCDSLRAEVYVRAVLPPGADEGEATIRGTLSGPQCSRAITLPVSARLLPLPDVAGGATPLARATLTEPSFWTPDLPSLYRLDASLTCGDREVATVRRTVGLRRFGVRGRSLWLDGRRFVPRAVAATGEPSADTFRKASVGVVASALSESFLDRCDAAGVVVIGLLGDADGRAAGPAAATASILRWARHPAVCLVIVPLASSPEATSLIAVESRGRRGTLLVACEVDGTRPPPPTPGGVDLLVVALPADATPHEVWKTSPPALPLVARCTAAAEPPSRRACDALQAALATWATAGGATPAWDWAGYLAG
ncbi:MAG: hypothetical protein FJ284_00780 [Planctomycetes bacterium]|nr:hypothetical protein [Planctomycetota bacterium]